MSIFAWTALGLLLWLAIVALILACARKMRMPECGAEEAADSVRGALTECPDSASTAKAWKQPTVNRPSSSGLLNAPGRDSAEAAAGERNCFEDPPRSKSWAGAQQVRRVRAGG